MSPDGPRVAVMLSGSGRTLENLLARITHGMRADIRLVIASRACRGAEIARAAGIETIIHPGEIAERDLARLLVPRGIGWVVLAGYLRRVHIPPEFAGRVVNIHPALLPAFGGPGMHGMHVHRAVADAARRGEVRETGCTVHLCTAEYDEGPIVLQRRCPVSPDDTPERIAARVFELELNAYPDALQLLWDREGCESAARE